MIPITTVGIYSILQLNMVANSINQDIPRELAELSTNTTLNDLHYNIRYYDEVLTQSARNYAFTKDAKWKARYNDSAPLLNDAIKKAIGLGNSQDKIFFSNIKTSSLALANMNIESIKLIDNGKVLEAITILESAEYASQKDIYNQEIMDPKHGDLIMSLTDTLNMNIKDSRMIVTQSRFIIITILLVSIIFIILLGFIISGRITDPINDLLEVIRRRSGGNLSERVKVESRDEVGKLGREFNRMADKLEEYNNELEEKIKHKTTTLEKANQFMMGRELKMIELKKALRQARGKQIKELNKQK
jgi:methyl-accepting chemotaxis protein